MDKEEEQLKQKAGSGSRGGFLEEASHSPALLFLFNKYVLGLPQLPSTVGSGDVGINKAWRLAPRGS